MCDGERQFSAMPAVGKFVGWIEPQNVVREIKINDKILEHGAADDTLETGEPVLDVYDRTGGNPVEAAQRLIAAVCDRTKTDVRAIALTGSGREAAIRSLKAEGLEVARIKDCSVIPHNGCRPKKRRRL